MPPSCALPSRQSTVDHNLNRSPADRPQNGLMKLLWLSLTLASGLLGQAPFQAKATGHARHFIMWDDPEWMFGHLDRFLDLAKPEPAR
jgi:hypothetical protein